MTADDRLVFWLSGCDGKLIKVSSHRVKDPIFCPTCSIISLTGLNTTFGSLRRLSAVPVFVFSCPLPLSWAEQKFLFVTIKRPWVVFIKKLLQHLSEVGTVSLDKNLFFFITLSDAKICIYKLFPFSFKVKRLKERSTRERNVWLVSRGRLDRAGRDGETDSHLLFGKKFWHCCCYWVGQKIGWHVVLLGGGWERTLCSSQPFGTKQEEMSRQRLTEYYLFGRVFISSYWLRGWTS